LHRQLRYEKVIAAVSSELLKPRADTANVNEALSRLLEGTEVSRVYIFENFHDPHNGLCMGQTYEVCAPGVPAEIDNPVLKHVAFNDEFQQWQDHLSAGESIWGNVTDFPEEERRVLEPQGIVSILVKMPAKQLGDPVTFAGRRGTRVVLGIPLDSSADVT